MKIWGIGLLVLIVSIGYSQKSIELLEKELTQVEGNEDKVTLMSELVDLYGVKPEAELYLKSLLDIGEEAKGDLKGETLRKAYSYYLKKGENAKALSYLQSAISWDKENNLKGLYHSYELYGKWYQQSLALDSAIYYYQLAESGYEKNNEYESLASVLNKQGIIQKNIQNFGEALDNYYKAYDISKAHQLDKNLASTCVNIGVVFKKQDQLDDAMEYYLKAEKIYAEQENFIGLANVYNNVGNIYRIKDEFDLALANYKKAILNRQLGGSEKTISYSYNNIALVYKEQSMYDSALNYLAMSEKFKIKLKEDASLSSTYLNFADTYALMEDSVNFQKYYHLARTNAIKYGQFAIVEELNILFSKYAASQGDYKKAYDFLVSVIQQMDTLSNKEQEVLSQVLQAQYNDKQKQEIILELENSLIKQKKQGEELENQAQQLKDDESRLWMLIIVLAIVFLFLVIALVYGYRSFINLTKNTKELVAINQELQETRLGAEEKDMMIKEIHHRVKNNLQVVKSLIRLQKEGASNETNLVLTDFENRVSSIALVHETLHGSIDLTKVDIEKYYKQLIQDLIDVYNVGQNITSEVIVDELSFGLETLIPLGLLTNEIVSNALKHGFKGADAGKLNVSLKSIGDELYLLEIADNGVGLSDDYLARNSLGLELIDTLVGQLDGSKELVVNNGTKYIIKFKNQDKIK